MLTIDFIDAHNDVDESVKQQTEALLKFAYDKLGETDNAEVSVSYISNEEIQSINRDYRGKDSVTDVISFALEDDEENLMHEEAELTLGDILIAHKVAASQAEDYNHSLERELLFLALHGFLHLMGYDHMNDEDEHEMNMLQDEILNDFGVTRD